MSFYKKKVALVTGSAGFIGYHLCRLLLEEKWQVIGLDCLSDYYDVNLKKRRESMLLEYENYRSIHQEIQTPNILHDIFEAEKPSLVVHLAAQAGVRNSIENPRSYLESNIVGTFELLEASKFFPPQHLLIASSSSVYGANTSIPYKEIDKTDNQISFYASTKKATENIAHYYSHLFELPITIFRFFTVYGPWGRPDMAMFGFTKAILSGEKIDLFNHGNMKRDFTYIDDLIQGIRLIADKIPMLENGVFSSEDSKSSVAPFRVVNIGNSKPEKLESLIIALEDALKVKAIKNFVPMQPGDVYATWADISLMETLTGFKPRTNLNEGVKKFVAWYLREYGGNN